MVSSFYIYVTEQRAKNQPPDDWLGDEITKRSMLVFPDPYLNLISFNKQNKRIPSL